MRRVVIALFSITAFFAASCGGGEGDAGADAAASLPTPSVDDRADREAPADEPAGEASDGDGASVTPDPTKDGEETGSDVDAKDVDVAVPGSSKSLVLAAVEKSASDQDSFRTTMTMVVGGLSELGGGEATMLIEAAMADGGQRSQVSMDMSNFVAAVIDAEDTDPIEANILEAVFGEPLEFRIIGDTTYVSSAMISFFVPVETAWVAFEGTGAAADLGVSQSTTDPTEVLALLRGIDDDAELVGTESIDGVSTTHIRGNLSVAEAIAAAPEGEAEAVEEALGGLDPSATLDLSVELFAIDVWIDDDGLVRRTVLSVEDLAAMDATGAVPEGAFMRLQLDFTDYGAEIVIDEPAPADVTVLDESAFGLGG